MKSSERPLWFAAASGLVLLILFAVVFLQTPRVGKEVSGNESAPLSPFGRIPEFSLTNQLARPVSRTNLLGRIWVADIIFTRCAGPCPKMSAQMSELQKQIPAKQNVGFLTLTTDPEFDTPEILKRYGKRFDADPKRWWFLTGTKDQIRNLAVEGLKLAAMAKPPEQQTGPQDLFIHSTKFVLVDERGQLRGVYEGTDSSQCEKLVADIRTLAKGAGP